MNNNERAKFRFLWFIRFATLAVLGYSLAGRFLNWFTLDTPLSDFWFWIAISLFLLNATRFLYPTEETEP